MERGKARVYEGREAAAAKNGRRTELYEGRNKASESRARSGEKKELELERGVIQPVEEAMVMVWRARGGEVEVSGDGRGEEEQRKPEGEGGEAKSPRGQVGPLSAVKSELRCLANGIMR